MRIFFISTCIYAKKAVLLYANSTIMDTKAKIAALRQRMRENGLNAYVVPGNDPHASEYMASHWCEMQWLSGFNGESGTVVVTLDRAFLWTDSVITCRPVSNSKTRALN